MTLDEIRYFVTAFECGSFLKTARSLNISQQGVGKSIRQLERELGVELFERTHSGVRPTRIARDIYPDCAEILRRESKVLSYVSAVEPLGRDLRMLGSYSELGDKVLRGVNRFNEISEKKVVVTFSREPEDEQARLFEEEGFDYRFATKETNLLGTYVSEEICKIPFTLLTGVDSALAERAPLALADLEGETVLVHGDEYPYVAMLKSMLSDAGVRVNFKQVSESSYVLRILQSSPDALFFVPSVQVGIMPWLPSVCVPLEMHPPLENTIVLQTRFDHVNRLLLDCIRASVEEDD